MKPNFALSLSFEGIRLLHRAAGGWRIVGDVALDAVDMADELAVLRSTATALEPGGLRTKVLLPKEQIKYLSIDTSGLDDAARMEAARASLDGATPYKVDDLAFDISADGDTTHVAAVARDTLAEAENFANEHRFYPISFAAVPGDRPYLGEPYFGPSKSAAQLLASGESVEPDGIAVVVIGDVDLPANNAPIVAPEEPEGSPLPDTSADPSSDVVPKADAPANKPEKEDAGDTAVPVSKEDSDSEEPEADPAAAQLETDSETTPQGEITPTPEPIPKLPPEPETKQEPEAKAEPQAADPALAALAADTQADTPAAPLLDAPTRDEVEPEADSDAETDGLPMLPKLGGASRNLTATSAMPAGPVAVSSDGGFSSRRTPEAPAPAAVVTSPTLPVETEQGSVASAEVSAGSIPPATDAPVELPLPDSRSLSPDPVKKEPVAPPKIGFLSRRKKKAAAASAALVPAANTPVPSSEEERMTVFGARSAEIGGKPRFLGLILTAVLLVFLAGVAAWASVFLDDGLSLSRLFGDRAPRSVAQAPDPEPTAPAPAEIETASLSPALSEEDTAVLDALSEPVLPSVATPDELEASYALTGIWPVAPQVPPEPAGLINIDDFYVPSIDPISTASDAVALPDIASLATDVALANVSAPAAAGTTFALDDRGLVIPTAQGALSPDGFTVYMGRPDLVPPATPTRFQAVPQADTANRALAAFRPKNRPEDLSETNERANLDGLTRSELAGYRPRFRPKSVQQQAAEAQAIAAAEAAAATAAAEAAAQETAQAAQPEQTTTPETAPASNNYVNPTRLAIQTSVRPDTRPRNFARIVRRAQRTPQPQAETRNASATVAPRVVTPKIPSSASVARQATVRNAINLRQVNLIGVYGKPSNRRALVRLANGRYKKVVVGDRIDGGRVSAIGDSELRYQKRGRSVVLKMPRG